MAAIYRAIIRLFSSILSFGLADRDKSEGVSNNCIEHLQARLSSIRASTAAAIADEYRLQQSLRAKEDILARIDADLEQPDLSDGVADQLKLRRELWASVVDEIKEQLDSIGIQTTEARERMALLREDIQRASQRAKDAEVRYQLAKMEVQIEELRLKGPLDEDLMAVEQLESRADSALAEAQALAELNKALGRSEGKFPNSDSASKQEDEACEQRTLPPDIPNEKHG